jgi:hypothetical protein
VSSEKYFDLSGPEPTKRRTFYFIMNCLLFSRLEMGDDPSAYADDEYEDYVNIYLANLLRGFMEPEYLEQARPLLSDYDTEVFQRLGESQDARLKYTVYKTNADFLLVSLGVFSSDQTSPEDLEPRFSDGREGRISRGKSYYQFAFSFGQQLPARSPVVNEVLRKLSVGFEKYMNILAHLRGEYFNLLSHLSHGEIYHLSRSVEEARKRDEIRQKQDEFLDAYLEWKAKRRIGDRSRLLEIARELQELDPGFSFDSLPV